MLRSAIEIPALGRVATLGGLYTAHEEKFFPAANLFLEEINEDQYDETEESTTEIKYCMTNTISEKLKSMDIGGEISLSLLAGLVKISGSGSYVSEDKDSESKSQMTLQYSIRTVNQQIFSVRRMKIDSSAFDIGATHVVVGIDWGARCNITCQYENKTNKSKDEVNAALKGVMKRAEIELDVNGHADIKNDAIEDYQNISFETKCDVSKLDKIPQTFKDALEIVKELPTAIKEVNDGKGIPLTYSLLPLTVVARLCRTNLEKDIVINQIEADIISSFTNLCERTSEVKLKLCSLLRLLQENDQWFPDSKIQDVKDLNSKIESLEGNYKSEFQDNLIKVRDGSLKSACLNEIIQKAMNSETGLPSIEKRHQTMMTSVHNTLEIKRLLLLKNVSFYGKDKNIVSLFAKQGYKLALYLPQNVGESTKELIDNINCFRRFAEDASEKKGELMEIAVVHTLFHPVNHQVPVITKYQGSQVVERDVLTKEGELLSLCCVKVRTGGISKGGQKAPQRTTLMIPCTKSYGDNCPKDDVIWYHSTCKTAISYGIVTKKLYCECGTFSLDDASFRCDNANHGMEFCSLNTYSKGDVHNLKMKDITNILILGETGVGKSTWINSIAKYLAYDSFDKAMKSHDTDVLIPSKFSFTNAKGETVEIKIGNIDQSDNEDEEVGASATQEPTSYLLNINEDTQIRLIDTPGIGDVRGITQDEKNFEMILEHMSYYDKIHGICILLKPNNARLGIMLKFCISELLTHLHKSAAKNIMFCFTNCRGTLYQPGETLPVLTKLLKEYKGTEVTCNQDNRFCFDNESFRFLACIQNGIEFSDMDISTFSGSWDKAVLETAKLFRFVQRLKPHDATSTLSLNNCRTWIIELSTPVAEIQRNINLKIKTIEAKKRDLEIAKNAGDDLKFKLKIMLPAMKIEHLDYPKTVCINDACTDVVTVDGISKREAKKSCHEPCNVSGVIRETVGDSRLEKCWINHRKNGKCCVCNHLWQEHKHISYDLVTYMKEEDDPRIKEMIRQGKSDNEVLEETCKNLNRLKQQEETELTQIMNISANFACYLAKNSITPYNDAVEQHLAYLIREKEKLNELDEKEKLETMLESYKVMKNIIDKAISNVNQDDDDHITTPEEAEALREKLFSLKRNGETFQNIYKGLNKIRQEYKYREKTFVPKKQSTYFQSFKKNVESVANRVSHSSRSWLFGTKSVDDVSRT